jgi:hypothetical protein
LAFRQISVNPDIHAEVAKPSLLGLGCLLGVAFFGYGAMVAVCA